MDNCPHQAVLVGDPAAAGAGARDRRPARAWSTSSSPTTAQCTRRSFAPFAEDLRGIFAELPVRRAADAALLLHDRGAATPTTRREIRELLVEHWTSPVGSARRSRRSTTDGARVFVEVGPRGNLTAFVEDILRGRPFCAVAADVQRRSSITQLNHLVGHARGARRSTSTSAYLFVRAPRARRSTGGGRQLARTGPKSCASRCRPSWPMLRLDQEALERLRGAAPAATRTTRPPPALAIAANRSSPASATATAAATAVVPEPPLAAARAAGAASPSPRAHGAGGRRRRRRAVMRRRTSRTMERFLDAGAEIMQAYLGAADALVAAGRRRGRCSARSSRSEPGVELVARADGRPGRGPLPARPHPRPLGLADRSRPHALALMPLAMSLEILAEAAAALVPGRIVVGPARRPRAPLARVEGRPATLEVRAQRLAAADGRGTACTSSCASSTTPARARPRWRRSVVLAARVSGAAAAARRAARRRRARRAGRPARLYEEAMFHGRAGRRVERRRRAWPPAARPAGCEALPRTGLLRATPRPRFVLDPVVLDAAGQLIGLLGRRAARARPGRVPLPARRARPLRARRGRRASRSTARRRSSRRRRARALATSTCVDADGRRWMRLTGWEDKRFDVPDAPRRSRAPSAGAAVGRLAGAVAALPGSRSRCRRSTRGCPPTAACGSRVWAQPRARPPRARGASPALELPREPPARMARRPHGGQGGRRGAARGRHGLDLLPADDRDPHRRARRARGRRGRGRAARGRRRSSRSPTRRARRSRSRRWSSRGAAAARRDRHRARRARCPALRRGGASAGRARAARQPCPSCARGVAAALLVREGGGRQGGRHRAGARHGRRRRDRRRRPGRGGPRSACSRSPGAELSVQHLPRRATSSSPRRCAADDGGSAMSRRRSRGAGRACSRCSTSSPATGSTTARSSPDTRFLADLGLESLDIVVLGTMLQQRYGRLPFAEFLEEHRPAAGRGARPHRRASSSPSSASTANPTPRGGVTWPRRC